MGRTLLCTLPCYTRSPLLFHIFTTSTNMLFNFKKLASLATAVTALSALTAHASPLEKRAQCAVTLSTSAVRAAPVAH